MGEERIFARSPGLPSGKQGMSRGKFGVAKRKIGGGGGKGH